MSNFNNIIIIIMCFNCFFLSKLQLKFIYHQLRHIALILITFPVTWVVVVLMMRMPSLECTWQDRLLHCLYWVYWPSFVHSLRDFPDVGRDQLVPLQVNNTIINLIECLTNLFIITATAILMLTACLLAAGAMGLWHTVEFFEKEKAVGAEFYQEWANVISYNSFVN